MFRTILMDCQYVKFFQNAGESRAEAQGRRATTKESVPPAIIATLNNHWFASGVVGRVREIASEMTKS